ncbi:hypothetical protein NUW58_g4344 [Xylaria curta]|uniref:Uncharacterized protein n=1 Tax=Xylaria curta TaxID=42375 RepID=A0ACC1P820_9PEZI|nr:hypothetical protein NUW58_g4344 [Xylaria curta]
MDLDWARGRCERAGETCCCGQDLVWTPEQVVDYLETKMAEGQFWVLCPDNDVTEDMDKRRMQWNTNDVLLGRPPLSRWREEYKEEFKEWMEKK